MKKEDIYLTPEELEEVINQEDSANKATDKAIKKIYEWFGGTCQHRVPFHTRSQCAICKSDFIIALKKMVDKGE